MDKEYTKKMINTYINDIDDDIFLELICVIIYSMWQVRDYQNKSEKERLEILDRIRLI